MRAMLQSDDLQHTLGILEEEGYIELSGMIDATSKLKLPSGPLASITAFTDLPSDPDPLRLQQARNFMTNTLNAFVGSLGNSSLLDRIEKSESHAELRALFDEWYNALVLSRDGRREAEGLRTKLLVVI